MRHMYQKCFFLLTSFMLLSHFSVVAQGDVTESSRYVKVQSGYMVVLRQGDSVFQYLEKITQLEKIPSASFSGIGFLGQVRFGFFNADTKEFEPKEFRDVELVSLSGSIAWETTQVSLHLHGVVADKNMQTYGGHILSAVVGTGSLEIMIITHDKKLERKPDPSIGAKVLQVPAH